MPTWDSSKAGGVGRRGLGLQGSMAAAVRFALSHMIASTRSKLTGSSTRRQADRKVKKSSAGKVPSSASSGEQPAWGSRCRQWASNEARCQRRNAVAARCFSTRSGALGWTTNHVSIPPARARPISSCQRRASRRCANRAWLALVCFADALVRWFQLLCCGSRLAIAEPKTLRWSFWHSPGRLVRTAGRWVVRILGGWPTADELLAAYRRIALLA